MVTCTDRLTCYVGLHVADSDALFASLGKAGFCRAVRLGRRERGGVTPESPPVFVGWQGDAALAPGTIELARPFAASLGLAEGEQVDASPAAGVPTAASVMVQPESIDDWEVVELQAAFIEERLLTQIAVLTPRMVFPVWIHGQAPVRLRVDARDANGGECFLLGRDSELLMESKRRAGAEKPVSVFDGAAPRAGGERSVLLRVLSLVEQVDAPLARVGVEDFRRLAGLAAPGPSCLAWLESSGPRAPAAAREGPQLLRVESAEGVPSRHVVVGACLARHARIPCFGIVRLRRCRHVPVHVPRLELVPLVAWPRALKASRGSDERWLTRQFEAFVKQAGEVELMHGSVVQLRAGPPEPRHQATSEAADVGASPAAASSSPPGRPPGVSSSSGTTDLYEGLSDIDDIYQQGGAPPCEVQDAGLGVYEVDLGLDGDGQLLPDGEFGHVNGVGGHGLDLSREARLPDRVPVQVRFALGAARAELGDPRAPPYARVDARSLKEEMRVTVAWPASEAGGLGEEQGEMTRRDQLRSLWAAVPGLQAVPDEAFEEVVQVVSKSRQAMPLDELRLFQEPAACLQQHLLAQLGCLPRGLGSASTAAPGPGVRPRSGAGDPFEASVPGCAVPGAVAITGASGSGKSELCHRVFAELAGMGVLPIIVSCTVLSQPSRKFKVVQEWLQEILRFACWYSPSAILLDDFGALCPDVEEGAPNLSVTEERSPILAEMLLDLLPEVRASGASIALAATLPDDAAVHRSLWRMPALEHKVPLRPPQLKERPEILQALCRQKAEACWEVDQEILQEGALDEWGGHVDGFGVADLARLVERACVEATAESSANLLCGGGEWSGAGQRLALRHLERARQEFVPATMTDQAFLASDTKWCDVGGLEGPKSELLDMLTMPTKYAVLVDRAPVRIKKGLMLVGPPGCGKTFLVHAAASETKGLLRFLTVKGPELLSKYIGASEAGVRQVFERAAAAAPSVLFFDEIEALAPKRGADSTGVTDRVVNQMLTYLDGVEDRGRVFVVAASGRPDLVDAALMRPGRFDRICYCGFPSAEDKLQICEILAAKSGLTTEGVSSRGVSPSDLRTQLRRLVDQMPRLFTCADIGAVFSSAKIEAVNEALKCRDAAGAGTGLQKAPAVTIPQLQAALKATKASVSEEDERRYAKVFAPYMPGPDQSALQRNGSEAQAGVKVALA